MSKLVRFLACLVVVLFLVEVIEPSDNFVRANVSSETSSAVFPIAQYHHHRHANSLIRPEQEKTREQNRSSTDDNHHSHRKTISTHSATAVSGGLVLIFEVSVPCELLAQARLNSLPPSSQIRPPSLA